MLDSSTMDYGCVVSKWWSIFSPLIFPQLPNFLIFKGCFLKKNMPLLGTIQILKNGHKNIVYVTSEQQDRSFTNFHGDQFKHNNHNNPRNHHDNPNLGWIMGLCRLSSCTSKSKDASKGLRVSSRGHDGISWMEPWSISMGIWGRLRRDVAMLEL